MAPNLFISYSHLDEEFVSRLTNELRRLNFHCWMDVYGRIQPGEVISENIRQAIIQSDFLICYLSDNSINSNWIKQEVELAYQTIGSKSIIFLCNSEALRSNLPECQINIAYPNFHEVRIPVLNDANFYKACLELIGRIFQSFQSVRFKGMEIENILEKSLEIGIKHIKAGEFTEQDNIRFRKLLRTSKEIKILAFNGGSFVRAFSEELKFFFNGNEASAKVLLASPKSEFYNENSELVSKELHKGDNNTQEIENTILRLESYLGSEKLETKLEVRHFNTQLRNPLFIFDNKICHITLSIPPVENFKSITLELERNSDESLVSKCIKHFDEIWEVSRQKFFWKL